MDIPFRKLGPAIKTYRHVGRKTKEKRTKRDIEKRAACAHIIRQAVGDVVIGIGLVTTVIMGSPGDLHKDTAQKKADAPLVEPEDKKESKIKNHKSEISSFSPPTLENPSFHDQEM